MGESWVRLWSGASTDPKWQTVSRKSGQPRSLVMALFMHLLLVANDADERGDISDLSVEDAASALDCDEEQVVAILDAMQGRVIEDGRLSGWERRQPSRNDEGDERSGAMSAAERKRLQRQREKDVVTCAEPHEMSRDVTQSHAMSRDVTQSHAPEAEAEAEAEVNHSAQTEEVDGERGGTLAGAVCARLRRAGIGQVNPSSPRLHALLAAGLTADEIAAAADGAAARGKGFAWVLAKAEGQRREAAAVGELPPARASPRRKTLTETRAETYAGLTGKTPQHPKELTHDPSNLIDGTAQRIAS